MDWIEDLLGTWKAKEQMLELHRALAESQERERELAAEVECLRSVFLKTAALNATLNFERVLELVLELVAVALARHPAEDARLVSVMFFFADDLLHVGYSRGLTGADARVVLEGEEGLIGEALAGGKMAISHQPGIDPELKRLAAMHTAHVAVGIPLAIGLEVYGLLLVAHPREDYIDQERLGLLEMVAQQATVGLQNAQLYRDLEQEKERISEIQEEARHKLARDLHDGPAQSIGAIAMRVNFARRLLERDPKATSEELYRIEELARRTNKEIRQMLFTLRPLVLESLGLVAALDQLAAKTRETHQQEVAVEAEPSVVDGMDLGKQGVVFYIVEEAVNNARKHAQALHIWVRLKRDGDLAVLEIEDDGVGFDLGEVEANRDQRGSLGLINLRERAELVNGVLQIDSAEGRGTLVRVTIPLTEEAAERAHGIGLNSR